MRWGRASHQAGWAGTGSGPLDCEVDGRWAGSREPGALDAVSQDFYAALAGEQGPALRAALRAVADRLLAEETPSAELDRLDALLDRLPESPATERLKLWRRYIPLGRKARDYELAGELGKAADAERDVYRFLTGNEPKLRNYIHVSALTSIALRGEELMRQTLAGQRP